MLVLTSNAGTGLPGDTVDRNLSADREDIGSIPDPGRFQVTEQLSLCTLECVFLNKRSHLHEKPANHNKTSPCLLQIKKAHGLQQRLRATINKNK